MIILQGNTYKAHTRTQNDDALYKQIRWQNMIQ